MNPLFCRGKVLFITSVLCLGLWIDLPQAEEQKKEDWLSGPREATVALGTIKNATVRAPDGTTTQKKVFAVVGTGALLGLPSDTSKRPYLVTAKHVFYDPKKQWDPASIQLRFSWFDTKPVDEYLGITIKLKEGNQRLWTPHADPDVDLAAMPLYLSPKAAGRESTEIIPLENFATADDLYESAPILVLGYPGAVGQAFWSRALARSGIVAWVHPTNPTDTPLLIDAMVYPGNSGGPVFKLPVGTDRFGQFAMGGKIKFLGIVSRGPQEEIPLKAMGKSIEVQGPTGPIKVVAEALIGIGVVEPASQVHEVLQAAHKSAVGWGNWT